MTDFLYGVSTAAFQIEGDDGTQGRGESVWDTFCRRENTVHLDQSPAVSADHYNRWEEDVALMKELGVNAYRFSVSWSRILPKGTGEINPKGTEFYTKLVDTLLACGMKPVVTLYHWDLPEALSERGGLRNPDFPKWFAEYTRVIADICKGKVHTYVTFNEPINCVHSSYRSGIFAPGLKLNLLQGLKCMHHLLLAHREAAQILHRTDKDAEVGVVTSTWEEYPASDTGANYERAKTLFFEKPQYLESVDTYLDPVYLGHYPRRLLEEVPAFAAYVENDDLSLLPSLTDFVGLNNYGGHAVDEEGNQLPITAQSKISNIGAVVDEKGLYYGVKFLSDRYGKPVIITETGCCCSDWISADGKVYDQPRIDCISAYLSSAEKLREEGYDLRGFFVWSLMDNFEWISGYSKRFGLIYIDFDTLKRTKKQSYYWYQQYIRKHTEERL